MKKIKTLFVFVCILFIPFIVNAEECNPSNIKIKNIEVKDKSDNVDELSDTTFENNKLHLDLKMYEVGDYIEYQLEIENDSNDDFLLNKDSLSINSDYFNYSISNDDNSNKIEAKGKKIIYLKVEYKRKVEDNKFHSDEYVSNNTITLKSSSNNNSIINPFTKNNKIVLTLGLLLVVILILYYTRSKRINKTLILLVGLLLPFEVMALCNFELDVSSKITIGKLEHNSDDNSVVYTANIIDGNYDTIQNGTNTSVVWIGQAIPNGITTYQTPAQAMAALKQAMGNVDRPFFLKHTVTNNTVTDSYVGFVVSDAMVEANPGMTAGTYYLKGKKTNELVGDNWQCMSQYDDGNGNCLDPDYNLNKATLLSAFGSSRCSDYSSYFYCDISGLGIAVYSFGGVDVGVGNYRCSFSFKGYSECSG